MNRLAGAIFMVSIHCSAFALVPGDRVDNFRLSDDSGKSHELHYHTNAKAIVLMVQGNGCDAVQRAMPGLLELRDQYQNQGVVFMLVNHNGADSREAIARESAELGYDLPILIDRTQLVGESLGADRAAEVLVVDPKTWTLKYRGALDDRFVQKSKKTKASKLFVRDALDAVLAGEQVAVAQTQSGGCPVSLAKSPEADQQISYAADIAPILIDNCVTCHSPGGIGPWAMTSYDMVKGFSLMMREVLLTQRMPPWHADPDIGHFANDRSLTKDETRMLVHWIEAGAPRGEGVDPLLAHVEPAPEWQLGPPDLVLELPNYDVPATGVVDYQYLRATNPLDHDVWVRAAEFIPGDRSAVHHVITRFTVPSEGGGADAFGRGARNARGGFGGYVPGSRAEDMPDGTGVLLPAGAVFTFQMHYTPYGKPVTDTSRLGIYFHKEPPTHRLAGTVMINWRLRIPPFAAEHSEEASFEFPRDALLYGLFPHAHYRGKAAHFSAVFPDGTEEVLLSVPRYDFNWQTSYRLAEPRHIPKGTKVTFTMTWDNSEQNPANPDPSKEVRWGQQSWQEMLFGTLSFRYLGDGVEVATGGEGDVDPPGGDQ